MAASVQAFQGRGALLFVALAIVGVALPTTASGQSLRLGFRDEAFASSDSSLRDVWFGKAAHDGASLARISVLWSTIAPKAPDAGFQASDPSSPGYEWKALDESVKSASAKGLAVMFTVQRAPKWAETPGRPSNVHAGTWKPDANAFGEFAHALAQRYDGRFPDPQLPGHDLPRVRYFEAWSEPNLTEHLSPQWEGQRLVGPQTYRDLLNAFYGAVKGVQRSATVVGGSLAPFGDPRGGERTPPVKFLRGLFCLPNGPWGHRCHERTRLDVLSDHPITLGPPQVPPESPLDISVANVGTLRHILEAAERSRRLLPRGPKPIWATEFWYPTKPPFRQGFPLALQARWYEQYLYLLWRQGVEVAMFFQLRDGPSDSPSPYVTQSGLYFRNGKPKPSQRAVAFPFVAQRTGRASVGAWGIAPHRGRVWIQVRRGGHWQTLVALRSRGRPHPFTAKLELHGSANLRARARGATSLVWRQR